MSPATDTVGCNVSAVVAPAPTIYVGQIQFGCVNSPGEVGELTYGPLMAAIASAQATGATYIDIVWGASKQLKQLYIYPVMALQQYCLEWLAMGPNAASCGPMLDCAEIVGGAATPGNFGTMHGFLGGACSPTDFDRALGTNTACVVDLDCLTGPDLMGIRLRIRVDCISNIIASINAADYLFFQSSTPVFNFAGSYCPNN